MNSEDYISIEGTLLMLDDKTPHVAVVVQAIRDEEVMATTLSDERGKYQFADLKPGAYQLRCQVLGGYVYYGNGENTDVETRHAVSLQVEGGKTLENIDFRFAPFKKGMWRTYTALDGLAYNAVKAVHRDLDGMLWFGTEREGASRFDGNEFVNFNTEDGLANSSVNVIHSDSNGNLWFGTQGGGIFRYNGKRFINFTTKDGLASDNICSICHALDGLM